LPATGIHHQAGWEKEKRFITTFRREHPHLPVIMIEDGLASNRPHIRTLESANICYILGAKEKDHEYLFHQAAMEEKTGCSANI